MSFTPTATAREKNRSVYGLVTELPPNARNKSPVETTSRLSINAIKY
jgi:hypothetical protein